jgi:hypothetical protein
MLAQHIPAVFEASERVLELAVSDGGRSHYKSAVSDSTGDVRELLGVFKNHGGVYGRTGLPIGHMVWVHEPHPDKPEVAHGTSRGANVQRIARRNEDDSELVAVWKLGTILSIGRSFIVTEHPL